MDSTRLERARKARKETLADIRELCRDPVLLGLIEKLDNETFTYGQEEGILLEREAAGLKK